jgi:hypothetical protein
VTSLSGTSVKGMWKALIRRLSRCLRCLNRYNGLLNVLITLLLLYINWRVYSFTKAVYQEPLFVVSPPYIECDVGLPLTDYLVTVGRNVPGMYPTKVCALFLENKGAPAADVSLHIALSERAPFLIRRIAVYDDRTKIPLPSTIWQWRTPHEQTEPRNVSMTIGPLLQNGRLIIRLDLARKLNAKLWGPPCFEGGALVIVRSSQVKTIGRAVSLRGDICWGR